MEFSGILKDFPGICWEISGIRGKLRDFNGNKVGILWEPPKLEMPLTRIILKPHVDYHLADSDIAKGLEYGSAPGLLKEANYTQDAEINQDSPKGCGDNPESMLAPQVTRFSSRNAWRKNKRKVGEKLWQRKAHFLCSPKEATILVWVVGLAVAWNPSTCQG